tara:strand:- start:225 stop:620 length:396 start_codon:yes stop_codon:yes gene_type:complete
MRAPTIFAIAFSIAIVAVCLPGDGWAHDCVVTDWAIARDVNAGTAIERGRQFKPEDKRVYTYVRLNCTEVTGPVLFRFERNGRPYATVNLALRPSPGWRTWASVRSLPGNWRVSLEIEGKKLLDDDFSVKP